MSITLRELHLYPDVSETNVEAMPPLHTEEGQYFVVPDVFDIATLEARPADGSGVPVDIVDRAKARPDSTPTSDQVVAGEYTKQAADTVAAKAMLKQEVERYVQSRYTTIAADAVQETRRVLADEARRSVRLTEWGGYASRSYGQIFAEVVAKMTARVADEHWNQIESAAAADNSQNAVEAVTRAIQSVLAQDKQTKPAEDLEASQAAHVVSEYEHRPPASRQLAKIGWVRSTLARLSFKNSEPSRQTRRGRVALAVSAVAAVVGATFATHDEPAEAAPVPVAASQQASQLGIQVSTVEQPVSHTGARWNKPVGAYNRATGSGTIDKSARDNVAAIMADQQNKMVKGRKIDTATLNAAQYKKFTNLLRQATMERNGLDGKKAAKIRADFVPKHLEAWQVSALIDEAKK